MKKKDDNAVAYQVNKFYKINIQANFLMEKKTPFINETTNQPLNLQKKQTQFQAYQVRGREQIKKIVQNYEFCLGDIITKNAYSTIYQGHEKTTQHPVAIKAIPIDKNMTSKQKYDLQNQIKLCKSLAKHRNLVQVLGTFCTANNYYVMMEQYQTDLKALLVKKKVLTQEEVVPIMLDILQGLRHLTVNGFMHCNIKPSNILLGPQGACLTDFALTRKLSLDPSSKPSYQPNEWTPYMSPLTHVTKCYDENNDVWSLGVLVYECLHGYHNYPWKFQIYTELLQKIYEKNLQFGRKVSAGMKEFLLRVLDPKSKIGVMDLYNDPFVKGELLKRKGEKISLGQNIMMSSPEKYYTTSTQNQYTSSNTQPVQYNSSPNKVAMKSNNNYLILPLNQATNSQPVKPLIKLSSSQSPSKYSPTISPMFQKPFNFSTQKQILDCQVAFMRFINIILKQDEHGYKPSKSTNPQNSELQEKKELDHKLFRLVMIKQVLGQKQWIRRTVENPKVENPFGMREIERFVRDNRDYVGQVRNILAEYDKKYAPLQKQLETLITDISQTLNRIKPQWRPRDILIPSLQRTQLLPILGIRLSRQLIKHIWRQIDYGYTLLNDNRAKTDMKYKQTIVAQMEQKVRRVDFLMSYYVMNCLLIDNFSDAQYFVKNSKLDVIMNNKPVKMQLENFGLVQDKLRILEII